jgi:hypothetical protein
VDDPRTTVAEMRRVLRPGGWVLVTIPHLFIAEGDFERHWSRGDLSGLFSDWDEVDICGIDGPATALSFVLGRFAMRASGRLPRLRGAISALVRVMNAVLGGLDRVVRFTHVRWPHSFVLTARKPPKAG